MRKIPIQNYFILSVIVVLSMMITFNVSKIYKEQVQKTSLIFSDLLYYVQVEELDNYLLENPNIIIYLVKDNTEINDLRDLIINNDLRDEIVLMDSNDFSSNDLNFINKKGTDINIGSFSNFIVFEDRKIKDVLLEKNQNLNFDLIVEFLKKHEVLNN